MKKYILIIMLLFVGCAITHKYPDISYISLENGFKNNVATLEQAHEFRNRLDKMFGESVLNIHYKDSEKVQEIFREQYLLAKYDYEQINGMNQLEKPTTNYRYFEQAKHYNINEYAYIIACLDTYIYIDRAINKVPVGKVENKM